MESATANPNARESQLSHFPKLISPSCIHACFISSVFCNICKGKTDLHSTEFYWPVFLQEMCPGFEHWLRDLIFGHMKNCDRLKHGQLRSEHMLIVSMHYVRALSVHKLEGLCPTPLINIHSRVLKYISATISILPDFNPMMTLHTKSTVESWKRYS